MAESSTKSIETGDMPEGDAPAGSSFMDRLRQNKLLWVLSAAVLGGLLLGVGGMTLIAYMQPATKESHAPPAIVTPEPDPKQEALAKELEELKLKNEKLEEQLQVSRSGVEGAASAHADPLPAATPGADIPHNRSAGAKTKEKVTADCTVPDKTANLGEKLKSCIEGFNDNTK